MFCAFCVLLRLFPLSATLIHPLAFAPRTQNRRFAPRTQNPEPRTAFCVLLRLEPRTQNPAPRTRRFAPRGKREEGRGKNRHKGALPAGVQWSDTSTQWRKLMHVRELIENVLRFLRSFAAIPPLSNSYSSFSLHPSAFLGPRTQNPEPSIKALRCGCLRADSWPGSTRAPRTCLRHTNPFADGGRHAWLP